MMEKCECSRRWTARQRRKQRAASGVRSSPAMRRASRRAHAHALARRDQLADRLRGRTASAKKRAHLVRRVQPLVCKRKQLIANPNGVLCLCRERRSTQKRSAQSATTTRPKHRKARAEPLCKVFPRKSGPAEGRLVPEQARLDWRWFFAYKAALLWAIIGFIGSR